MNVIGDLERLFATSLYPFRVPIAVAIILAGTSLIVLARRRGWTGVARRHPRLTAAVVAIGLLVGTPVAWYLASPLFIRTELVESLPAAIAEAESAPSASPSATVPRPAAGSSAAPNPSADPTREPTQAPTPFAPSVLASGSFQGADDFHFGTGEASIVETAPGRYTLRFEQFSVRNGPDLYVYLSADRGGYADGALELGPLKATDGAFGYELPAGADPGAYASAVVWCKQFAVLFAVAPLEAS